MVITNQGIQKSEASYKRRVHRKEASLNTLVPLIYLNKICINIFCLKNTYAVHQRF